MAMVCPRCLQAYDQQLYCRDCGCRLQFQADSLERTPSPLPEPEGPWQHTPWGKIVVGLLLALGISYGLQQLCIAWQLGGSDGTLAGAWTTLWGVVLLHLLQGISLIVGGAVTGAGQPRGLLYGSVVGLISGGAFLALQRHQGDGQPDMLMFTQPVMHALFGMAGGFVGMLIWKPPPTIPLSTTVAPSAGKPTVSLLGRLFSGRIHYGRIFAGVFVVVAGVVWSKVILEYMLRASNGTLAVSSHLQARLIGWEIAAMVTLLGAGVAGATTFNGLKQGLFVGLGSAVVIAGVHFGNDKLVVQSLAGMVGTVVVLSLAGGWFGGQLFPPIFARRRRSLSSLM
jgi:hypothetical protein